VAPYESVEIRETADEIHSSFPDVKVVLMSAYHQREYIEGGLNPSVVDVVPKASLSVARLRNARRVRSRGLAHDCSMISSDSCPRCKGAVLEYLPPEAESALCINCGWRRREIPLAVQVQVKAHLGQPRLDEGHAQSRIGTGKSPLNGWDRVKQRKERDIRNTGPDTGSTSSTRREPDKNAAIARRPSVGIT
jgi:Zn ribbon nucleic-acid-binding protein